jgi:hypothetical protein
MTAPPRTSSVVSVVFATLVASSALWSGPASAEPSPADRQAATTLFKEGKALLDKGQVPDACRKFEASQRLDPAAGTLLNLAVCHEKEGRTASAWYEFTDALAAARKDNRTERIKLAEEHIAKLEPLLVRLTIDVSKANEVPDLEVRRDGALLARAGWGIATPIDPGEHKIEAKAKGRLPFNQTIQLDAKSPTKTVTIPALAIDPEAARAAAAASAPPADTVAAPAPAPPPPPAETSHRGRNGTITTVVGGAVLVGAGVVGFLAKSKWDNAQDACPRKESCSAAGSDETKKAGKLADAATGLGVVGAIVTGIGVYLLSTAPASTTTSAQLQQRPRIQPSLSLRPDGGGAFLSGSF